MRELWVERSPHGAHIPPSYGAGPARCVARNAARRSAHRERRGGVRAGPRLLRAGPAYPTAARPGLPPSVHWPGPNAPDPRVMAAQAAQRGLGRPHLPRLRLRSRPARQRRLGGGRAGLRAQGRRRGPALGSAAGAPAAVSVASARASGATGWRREARGGADGGHGGDVAGLGAPAARAQSRADGAGGSRLRPRGERVGWRRARFIWFKDGLTCGTAAARAVNIALDSICAAGQL